MSPLRILFSRLFLVCVLPVLLAGCGGMNRAVAVLPNTTDDLAAKTEPFRRGRDEAPDRVAPPPAGF